MVSPVRALWRGMATHRRELALAGVLGAVASLSAVALLGTSAWLIATAAQMPPVLTLTVAAVMVRFRALSRLHVVYAVHFRIGRRHYVRPVRLDEGEVAEPRLIARVADEVHRARSHVRRFRMLVRHARGQPAVF